MAPPLMRRFPLGPLLDAAGCTLRVQLARRLAVHNAQVYNGAEFGITAPVAAAWCHQLGIDPDTVWDDWWPPTDEERALSAAKSAATGGLLGEVYSDNSRDQSWRAHAACKGMTDVYFATDDRNRDRAVTVCRGCPVRHECYEDAVSRPIEQHGAAVTAGLSKRKLADARYARLKAQRQGATA